MARKVPIQLQPKKCLRILPYRKENPSRVECSLRRILRPGPPTVPGESDGIEINLLQIKGRRLGQGPVRVAWRPPGMVEQAGSNPPPLKPSVLQIILSHFCGYPSW